MIRVDLNSDLGESFGVYQIGMDEQVIAQISSANIACGFHAGDPGVMARTVRTAVKNGTAIGAHPGFFDLLGFGRREMHISPDDARDYVSYQLGALYAFARSERAELQHVKAHGALYNMAATDYRLAHAICQAIKRFDSQLICCGLPGSRMREAADALNLRYACEAFADRAYMPDGTLAPRGMPGAMIEDAQNASARVLRMLSEGLVRAIDGQDIAIRADTVCLHGDSPHALDFARALRSHLCQNGVEIVPMARLV